MKRIKDFFWSKHWFIVGLLLSFMLVLVWFAAIGEKEFLILFSSDALYLPSIYQDIFVDGNSMQGWNFNAAPNFVPDMLLFFILMKITSNFLTATFLFSIIQYFGIIFLFYIIFKKVSNLSSSVFAISVYLFSFFLLFFLTERNSFYYSFLIMSNSYHNGMFIMALTGLLLAIQFFRKESWVTLCFIFVLFAVSYPCDRLFLVTCACPIIFTIFVLLIGGYNKRTILKLGLACVLGTLSGMVILDKLEHNSVFLLGSPHQYLTVEAIVSAWTIFSAQIKDFLWEFSFKSLTVFLSIIAYLWTIYYCVITFLQVKRKKNRISLFFIFELFVLFSSPMILMAPVLSGNYLGYDCLRYNYFSFIVLLFNLVLLADKMLKQYRYLTIGLNCVLSMALALYLSWNVYNMDFINQLKNYFSFYPQYARNLDKQFPTNNQTCYGITDDYRYAKHATMFSKNSIRLYVVFPDAIPYFHVTNPNWYLGGGNWKYANPQFTFLLWSSDMDLPDFFKTQNPPSQSCMVDENNTLYWVQPFIFDKETFEPKLLIDNH